MTIIGIVIMVVLICLVIYVRYDEKKHYNNGFCPNCGTRLRCFDVDSQGGRMYKCDACEYYTSVTYNIDRSTRQVIQNDYRRGKNKNQKTSDGRD